MSLQHTKKTHFEYKIVDDDGSLSAQDSYALDLLGFLGEVPLLATGTIVPISNNKEQGNSDELVEDGKLTVSPILKLQQHIKVNSGDGLRLEDESMSSTNEETNSNAATQTVSPIQGKKVIIRTDTMSGKKSLIFQQKTGEKVEIPAKLSNLLNNSQNDTMVKQAAVTTPHPDNVALVVFPQDVESNHNATQTRHKPSILKRRLKKSSEIKIEQASKISAEQTITAPNDHDYSSVTPAKVVTSGSQSSLWNTPILCYTNPTPANAPTPPESTVGENVPNLPIKIISCCTLDPKEPAVETQNGTASKVNEVQLKKGTVTNQQHYEIINKHIAKKAAADGVDSNKNTFFVMISNKETKDPVRAIAPKEAPKVRKINTTQSTQKIPSNLIFKKEKTTQTTVKVFKDASTSTEEHLLNEFLAKKAHEMSLKNKASKTTNTEDSLFNVCFQKETVLPSPFLDLCNILDEELNVFEDTSTAQSTDILIDAMPPTNYSFMDTCTRTCMCKQFGNINNRYMNNMEIQNAELTGVSWKFQFFVDLKNCNQFDLLGNMPIHNAVIANNIVLLRRQCLALSARKIDINTLNHNSLTALQLAILHDADESLIKLLLEYGADVTLSDSEGNSIIHSCVTNARESTMTLLLTSNLNVDINGTNFNGYTPLIMCALHQKYVKADTLLSMGANPNICDKKSGRTALFHAVEVNDLEMVKLLMNYKAQPKIRNFIGTSPHDATFELDYIDPMIRQIILNRDDPSIRTGSTSGGRSKSNKKKRKHDDRVYHGRPSGTKFIKI